VDENITEVFRFERMKDFTIDATDMTFVFTQPEKSSMIFRDCKNVTLRGATFNHDPHPFSQGEIVAISAKQDSIDVRVERGYPAEIDNPKLFPITGGVEIFDPTTRQQKVDTLCLHYDRIERLAENLFRFHLNPALSPCLPEALGDLASWRGVRRLDITVLNCAHMKIFDVTIVNGSGFCIHEIGGEGGGFYRYKVTYGPKPVGSTKPLRSADADAFHSNSVRKGPTLEDCVFEGIGDEGINIYDSASLVHEMQGNVMLMDSRRGPPFRAGDRVRIYNRGNVLVAESVVARAPVGTDYLPSRPPPEGLRYFAEIAKSNCYEVPLDRELPEVRFGMLAVNPDSCGRGFVIRRCTIRDNRARTMLISAKNGLIEDCVAERRTNTGIVVSSELSWWNDPDYARNLVIRRNVIRGTGTYRLNNLFSAGSLNIAAYENKSFAPLPGGHRNILIEDNISEDNDDPNLLLTSAQGVAVRGNRFVRPMQKPHVRGSQLGIVSDALIQVIECADVRFEDNHVDPPGGVLHRLVTVDNSHDINEMKTGIVK
jgi:hypothetical protein